MTPISRTSETVNLEQRYLNQREGGAFDAKRAGKSNITPSMKSKLFETSTEYLINAIQGQSEFKGVDGSTYTEISNFGKGIDTTPYKK
jgi:hypothetical protein